MGKREKGEGRRRVNRGREKEEGRKGREEKTVNITMGSERWHHKAALGFIVGNKW